MALKNNDMDSETYFEAICPQIEYPYDEEPDNEAFSSSEEDENITITTYHYLRFQQCYNPHYQQFPSK